jgi:hypothetical protein
MSNNDIHKAVRDALALGFSFTPERKPLRDHILRQFATCAHCNSTPQYVAMIRRQRDGGEFEEKNLKPMCAKHMIEYQIKEWFSEN